MIIIKYYEWLKIQPDLIETVYEQCDDNFKKVKQITKEEAISFIEDNNLQRVHRNKYGAIWK